LSGAVIFSLVCIGLALALLKSKRHRLASTTLIAPYRWAWFGLLMLSAAEMFGTNPNLAASTLDALRYMAATTTFCPLMAILGAKRPQNVGWQFIVVTLWIVLILPVGEMMVFWRGGVLDVGPLRQWFFVVLLLVGLSNYSLTRFCVPVLLATTGQTLLLLPHLPIASLHWSPHFHTGVGWLAGSVLVAWLVAKPRTTKNWDTVWSDFRDAFGLVWSLRVMERMNSTAKLSGWQSSLTWYGFSGLDLDNTQEQQQIERALRTVLRRFVSDSWIASRVEGFTSRSR